MNRRSMLGWISALLAAACAAVIAIPGFLHRLALLRKAPTEGADANFQQVAFLADLPPGKPIQRVITGTKQDAWTRYPQEKIGSIWLVNQSEASTPPEEAQVVAFSAVCPHEACDVSYHQGDDQFVCPCHGAAFHKSGAALSKEELGKINPSPRGLDPLECKVVHDEEADSWVVEVVYKKFKKGLAQPEPLS